MPYTFNFSLPYAFSFFLSQVSHPARACPGFLITMNQPGVSLLYLDGMQIHCKVTPLPPAFHQASLATNLLVPIYLYTLVGERHCESSVLPKSTTHQPSHVLNLEFFNLDSSALTIHSLFLLLCF